MLTILIYRINPWWLDSRSRWWPSSEKSPAGPAGTCRHRIQRSVNSSIWRHFGSLVALVDQEYARSFIVFVFFSSLNSSQTSFPPKAIFKRGSFCHQRSESPKCLTAILIAVVGEIFFKFSSTRIWQLQDGTWSLLAGQNTVGLKHAEYWAFFFLSS